MASDPTDSDAIAHEKARLRREVIAQRIALPPAEAMDAARRAVRHLWSLPVMANARNLAIYLPVGSELDCTPIASQAWARGKNVLVPIVDGATLRFAPLTPKSELRRNFLGILEPVTTRRNLRSARQLDIIVAPLLAFDESGHRLGMGGGYYDRTLAFLNARSRQRRPHFIGIAFEIQRRSSVPTGELDVRLNFIATDHSTGRFT
ncbi:MAG: 5-formyltetrahydrofolate cyclo-ligase [Gammaproteobacteria bacterium]